MARHGENIYKRKDGRWEGRYRSGTKSDGTSKYSSVYAKSYKEVKSLLSEKREKTSSVTIPRNLTVNNLFGLWFAEINLKVKASTYANYQMKYEKHIFPVLGNIYYDKLTVEKLNDFVRRKLSDGLSSKYISDIVAVIKSVCRFAKRRFGYDDRSEYIVLPKEKPKEKQLLDKSEMTQLSSYLTSNPTASNIGILLASSTGIRIGELCALQWSDINFEKKTFTVRRTVQRIKNNDKGSATRLYISSPKSFSSAREIPLPDFIIPFLNSIKTREDCYILSGTGKIVEPRTMQYRFKSILEQLKFKNVTFHSLRHGFATSCIALGFDVKTLSEILGHSSVNITLNRYVHTSMERKAEFMKSLSALFSAA